MASKTTPATLGRTTPGRVRSVVVGLLGDDGINSAAVWLILVAFLVAVRLLVSSFYPNAFNDPE